MGGGSSGAPSVTGFGIMGMLLEDIGLRRGSNRSNADGFQRIKVLDIGRIREIVTKDAGIPWTLEEARNLLPESWQAARHNLTTTLNDYLFNLQNVHEYLNRGWAKPDELRRIIPAYNRSYKKYYQERTVHRAAVAANWGDSVEMQFLQIQEEIKTIHSDIFSLNTYREQLYNAGPSLPDEVMRVVQSIQPKIGALMQDYTGFQRLLGRME